MDELLHSTFFIKIMDVDCWLFVEDRPHQPELGWLLSLWGGYRVAPRYEGEVGIASSFPFAFAGSLFPIHR